MRCAGWGAKRWRQRPSPRRYAFSTCEARRFPRGASRRWHSPIPSSACRHLDLAENPIGPGGLAALAESPHLRGLRALDLAQLNSARGPIASRDVSSFLNALDLPELRHLHLDLLPVGIRGAKLIASRPQFANLTRLGLAGCAIGDAGARALVRSQNLANLVVLDLSANKLGRGAARLANRKVLPRLAHCRLGTGVPKSTAARLRRRPGVRV